MLRKLFRDISPLACAVVVFSSVFQAFGIYHVHAVSGVTEGGVLGATLLLQHWFDISPAVSSFVFNVILYAIGWKTLGRTFLIYSAVATLTYSAAYGVIEQFPPLWPELYHMPLAAALLGAVFIGIGAGLCVRAGGATCGDDALAMSLVRILNIKIERIYLVSDMTVLLLSLSYIPFRRIAYSLLTVILSGQIIGLVQRIPFKKATD
ncbi:MAG: YitT family protein [Clostridia bacterium]|nr:YitT family protein [Clostridia bacterium]